MIKTEVYAHISRESLYEIGTEIGLTGEALKMFTYFEEVKLTLLVDKETGHVKAWYAGGIHV
jgi:hypothetical protein